MQRNYRVVLAEDHAIVRQGLVRLLSDRTDLEVVAEAATGIELLSEVRRSSPDLVITDISMPGLRGIEAIAELRPDCPRVKFLVLSMHSDDELLEQAVAAGADGYVLKEDAVRDLFEAIDAVMVGKSYLSPRFFDRVQQDWWSAHRKKNETGRYSDEVALTLREKEIVKMIAEGKSSKEIAALLFLSPRTVEHHRSKIMGKLNLKNAAEVARFALERGLVTLILHIAAASLGGGLLLTGLPLS